MWSVPSVRVKITRLDVDSSVVPATEDTHEDRPPVGGRGRVRDRRHRRTPNRPPSSRETLWDRGVGGPLFGYWGKEAVRRDAVRIPCRKRGLEGVGK